MTDLTFSKLKTLPPRAAYSYLAAFFFALIACFAAPRALSFAPALIALIGIFYLKIKLGCYPTFDRPVILFFAALSGLSILSAAWAPDTHYALIRGFKIFALLFSTVGVLAMANILPAQIPHKDTLIKILVLFCCLFGVTLFIESETEFFFTRFFSGVARFEDMPERYRSGYILNRGTVYLTLITLPVALMVWLSGIKKKRLILAALFVCVGAAILVTRSQTSQIAAILCLLMVFYPSHRKIFRQAVLYCVLALMIAAPFIIKPTYDYFFGLRGVAQDGSFLREASIPHRLEVWKFAAEQIMQKPILGHGVDSMRFLKAGYIMQNMKMDHVLHPHNAVLEIWLEFGAIGILLVTGFVVFLFARMESLSPLLQRYYTLLFIVSLSVLSMGYGLWQPWLLGMMTTLVAVSITATRIKSP